MRAASSIGRCLSLVVWLRRTVGGFRKCAHDTHLRVFAATGAGGSGVLLYVRDTELEYLDCARTQREHPPEHRKVDAARAGEQQSLAPARVVHARAQPHHPDDEHRRARGEPIHRRHGARTSTLAFFKRSRAARSSHGRAVESMNASRSRFILAIEGGCTYIMWPAS